MFSFYLNGRTEIFRDIYEVFQYVKENLSEELGDFLEDEYELQKSKADFKFYEEDDYIETHTYESDD